MLDVDGSQNDSPKIQLRVSFQKSDNRGVVTLTHVGNMWIDVLSDADGNKVTHNLIYIKK